jgi:acetamidase/formamidase
MKSGHTVTRPIRVVGAEIGDGIALKIRDIKIDSRATASGVSVPREGSYLGDPFVAKKCPGCGTLNPHTRVEGFGPNAVRCRKCDTPVSAFRVTSGYTMIFGDRRRVGVTCPKAVAELIAQDAMAWARLPRDALCHPVLALALADMPSGIVTRVRPMIGNIGTIPAVEMPSSHNAGDFGQFLVGAPHKYALVKEDLVKRTDSHMDIDTVGKGSILIAPVKVDGAGVIVGDAHAMQGDGEIAGHTTDVSSEVTLEVELVKDLNNNGPILLPNPEDLPPLARPFQLLPNDERREAQKLAKEFGFDLRTDLAPVQAVGSGANLNEAVDNGLDRMARLSGMTPDEVKNLTTITGGIEIGRLPGIIQVTMQVPTARLEKIGMAHLVKQQYQI